MCLIVTGVCVCVRVRVHLRMCACARVHVRACVCAPATFNVCVCLSVGHNCEPCKTGWTDRGAVWSIDSGGPKESCISYRSDTWLKEHFWGVTLGHAWTRLQSIFSTLFGRGQLAVNLHDTDNTIPFASAHVCMRSVNSALFARWQQ